MGYFQFIWSQDKFRFIVVSVICHSGSNTAQRKALDFMSQSDAPPGSQWTSKEKRVWFLRCPDCPAMSSVVITASIYITLIGNSHHIVPYCAWRFYNPQLSPSLSIQRKTELTWRDRWGTQEHTSCRAEHSGTISQSHCSILSRLPVNDNFEIGDFDR